MKTKLYLILICCVFTFTSCTQKGVTFETLTYNQTYKSEKVTTKFHPSDDQMHGAFFDISYTYPTAGANSAILTQMQKAVIASLFGPDYADYPANEAMNRFIEDRISEYDSMVDDLIDDMPEDEPSYTAFINELIGKDSVYFANDQLVQYGTKHYSYEGGAHGSTDYSAVLFDIKNDRILTAYDVFIEDESIHLRDLLMEAFMKYNNYQLSALEDTETLNSISECIWKPETVFAVADKGVYFCYSSYELGYYALGAPELFLPYSQLEELIRPDSPVYQIAIASTQEDK